MKRLVLVCLLSALAIPVSAMQQAAPPPGQPAQAPPPQGRGRANAPQPPEPSAAGQQGGRGAGRGGLRYDSPTLQNVRIELTLNDAYATETASKKTVTMIVIDGNSGAIRSTAASGQSLNVDAEPHIRPDGKIFVSLSLQYYPSGDPSAPAGQARQNPAILNESLVVLLTDGKPMMVSQSADPRTDRKVTLDVMATVVK